VYKKFSPNIVVRPRFSSHRYAIATTFLQESSDTKSEGTESTDAELASRALRRSGGGTGKAHGGLESELAWFMKQSIQQSEVAMRLVMIEFNAVS